MKKIKTIFDRNWEGDKTVLNKYVDGFDPIMLLGATATEKLDGMNVRVTVRNHILVRLEKRRNPDKLQKAKGIEDPWYVDADEFSPEDKYLWEAAHGKDFSNTLDGEWSGEVIGKNVQGNPLNLQGNVLVLFSCGEAPVFEDVPTDYEGLKAWLPAQKSKFGNDCGIEGIVWHCPSGNMYKIKCKDFVKDNRK